MDGLGTSRFAKIALLLDRLDDPTSGAPTAVIPDRGQTWIDWAKHQLSPIGDAGAETVLTDAQTQGARLSPPTSPSARFYTRFD